MPNCKFFRIRLDHKQPPQLTSNIKDQEMAGSCLRSRYAPPLLLWLVYPMFILLSITGGIGVYLFRGIQTHRYYDWTILPALDTRLEAVCGELTLYYMSWQNPGTEKPIGHVAASVDSSFCAKNKQFPTPATRFPGLGDPIVLKQLGCQPEGESLEEARSWNCTQPVGAKLRAEIEASNR